MLWDTDLSVSAIENDGLNIEGCNNIMAQSTNELKPTLGLVGITINAMALIAPGAFLWTTYQLQAPPDSAKNMWAAIALATCIALLTARG